MRTNKVIYITKSELCAVESTHNKGAVQILKKIVIPIKDGEFNNGSILNTNSFVGYLTQLKGLDKRFTKDITVIADSSSVVTKKIELPDGAKPEVLKAIAKKELAATADENSEVAMSSCLLPDSNSPCGYCCAIDKKIVTTYLSVFKDAGYDVDRVDVPLSCILNIVHTLPDYATRTFLLNVADNDIVYSVIFKDGNFTFSSRDRLFANRDSDEYTSAMSRKVDQMLSYYSSHNPGESIKDVYFYGLTDAELNDVREYFENTNIETFNARITYGNERKSKKQIAEELSNGVTVEKEVNIVPFYTFACGNKIGTNLLESIHNGRKTSYSLGQRLIMILLPSVAIMVSVLVSVNHIIELNGIKQKTADINTLLASAEYNQKYNDAIGTYRLSDSLTIKYDNLMKFDADIACNKVRTDVVKKIIEGCPDGVVLTNLNYTTSINQINISGIAANEVGPANYVKTLKNYECFYDVEYRSRAISEGYSFNLNMTVGSGNKAENDANEWAWENGGQPYTYVPVEGVGDTAEPDEPEYTGDIWEVQTPDGVLKVTSQADIDYIKEIYPNIDISQIIKEGGFN